MHQSNYNHELDSFFENAQNWQAEMEELRLIVLDSGLKEELKWKQPCYTHNDKNICIISEFKDNCVLSFIKGALLKDTDNILEKPGENSRSVRFVRFTDKKKIHELAPVLTAYIYEAIEIEKAGLKIEPPKQENQEIPEELTTRFQEKPALKAAFEALTPGRQRAYLMFFSAAKQSKTKFDRIDKYTSRILKGKGMNDCVCGLSKRMPNCDGSHKYA